MTCYKKPIQFWGLAKTKTILHHFCWGVEELFKKIRKQLQTNGHWDVKFPIRPQHEWEIIPCLPYGVHDFAVSQYHLQKYSQKEVNKILKDSQNREKMIEERKAELAVVSQDLEEIKCKIDKLQTLKAELEHEIESLQ